MALSDVEAKTTIVGFSNPADTATIRDAMRTAYEVSPTAQEMFDNFIASPGHQITITGTDADEGTGNFPGFVSVDLSSLWDNTYITPTGKAVEETPLSLIMHELGHALTPDRQDDLNDPTAKGPNITFVNKIYADLGIPERVSYEAYDKHTDGKILTKDFEYTNGAAIDRAFCELHDKTGDRVNWDSSPAGDSRDLLIGGPSANTLKSGAGNDFLFGGGGSDTLDGGPGDDTYWGGAGTDVYGPIQRQDHGLCIGRG